MRVGVILPNGAWRDRPCFIIGNGPSANSFPYSALAGRHTIALNSAWEKLHRAGAGPSVCLSIDMNFWRKHSDALRRESACVKLVVDTLREGAPDIDWTGLCRAACAGADVFTASIEDGLGHGKNSCYAALNLASCLGAEPIYLVGIDANGDHPTDPEYYRRDMIPMLERLAKYLGGVRDIYNLNPASAVRCFPFTTIEEALAA